MEVKFNKLNDAIKNLPYARVYSSPMDKDNYFNIEVKAENGGNYSAMKELVKLAEKEGYKYDKYYEMHDIWGEYHYTAVMYVDEPNKVRCYYDQNGVYVVGED